MLRNYLKGSNNQTIKDKYGGSRRTYLFAKWSSFLIEKNVSCRESNLSTKEINIVYDIRYHYIYIFTHNELNTFSKLF